MECVASTAFGFIHDIEDNIDLSSSIEDIPNGEFASQCQLVESTLISAGGQMGADTFCSADVVCPEAAAAGPEGPGICEAIFAAICVLDGGNSNPCAWLLDHEAGSACDHVGNTLGGVGQGQQMKVNTMVTACQGYKDTSDHSLCGTSKMPRWT